VSRGSFGAISFHRKRSGKRAMFHFIVDEDLTHDYCKNLSSRNQICTHLEIYGFDCHKLYGGKATFHDTGDYDIFRQIVELFAKIYKINVIEIENTTPY
jgi:hypothetical protein